MALDIEDNTLFSVTIDEHNVEIALNQFTERFINKDRRQRITILYRRSLAPVLTCEWDKPPAELKIMNKKNFPVG